jgi:hypothetical protein
MKTFLAIFSLCFLACAPLRAQNDNSQPLTLIGSSLSIHAETFDWVEASDDGTYRTDVYSTSDLSYSVSVVTKLLVPGLASVSGSSSWGTVDGHLSSGSYSENYVESGTPGSGSWETWTYSVDLAATQLAWTHVSASDDGSGNSSSSWVNSAGEWGTRSDSNDGNGNTSWSESWGEGATTERTREGGSSYEHSPTGGVSLFGRTFGLTSSQSGWSTETLDGVETANSGWESRAYSDGDSTLEVGSSSDTVSSTASTWISGWTPEIGSFSATLPTAGVSDWSAVVWDARTAPSFAPDTLWVNGWLVSWQSGTLSSSGVVTDVYAGAGGQLGMVISGDAREVVLGNTSAVVSIQGAAAGSVGNNQSFSMTGWTVSSTGAEEPSSTPFFLPSVPVLWVEGLEYTFEGGLSDGNGGHVDTYTAQGGAGTLRLAGSTAGTAHVAGNLHTAFFHGSLASGAFDITGAVVAVSTQPPPAALPEALWLRGGFYAPDDDPATTGVYAWDPAGDAGPFTLTVAAVPGGFGITGADDVGAFSGVLPAGGGLHFLHAGVDASAPQVVPVIQATTGTGAALGSGENLDAHPGLPLAVEVQGDILVFKGTLSGPARAVYVPEDTRTGKRWLALRLDTRAASLTDLGFAPAAVTAGSYDAETHLFSTPHGSGSLPEYVHAADPEVSHAHWRLPLPVGMDLPPSFIVRGQPWWFAGWDDSPNANVATYRGFYDGQIMTVEHAMQDPAAPVDRLVTLVDPVHNAGLADPFQETQGTLSGVRRSVRLRDGTLVLSGNALGGQEIITPTDDYSLHTIRSKKMPRKRKKEKRKEKMPGIMLTLLPPPPLSRRHESRPISSLPSTSARRTAPRCECQNRSVSRRALVVRRQAAHPRQGTAGVLLLPRHVTHLRRRGVL